jgi:hypothetical protein
MFAVCRIAIRSMRIQEQSIVIVCILYWIEIVWGQTTLISPVQSYGWQGDTAVSIGGFGLMNYAPTDQLELQISTSESGVINGLNPSATGITFANGGTLPATDIAIDAAASDLILAMNNFTYTPATSTFRGDVSILMILYSMPSQSLLDFGAFTITIRPVNQPAIITLTGTYIQTQPSLVFTALLTDVF